MPGGNNSFWWANRSGWRPTAQGGPESGGGGYGSEYPVTIGQYRDDPLDAARSGAFGAGRTGEATYPDGYLQDTSSRRREAPASVYGRLTDRSYQRGVNAGVKMDMQHYFWPEELSPDRGLASEEASRRSGNVLTSRRNVPYGTNADRLMHGPSLGQVTDDTPLTPQKTAAIGTWMPGTLW